MTNLPTDVLRKLAAQGTSFTTPDIDPGSLSYSSSGSWDGDDAVASYPNDVDDYSDHFLLVPTSDEDRGDKSAYKLPFRSEWNGPVDADSLVPIIGAVNGARGGIEGVSRDTLQDAYDMAVDMAVQAGVYDEADEAPGFEAIAAGAEARVVVSGEGSDGSDQQTGGSDAPLTGVVWGAGVHSLHVNGKPTDVLVPDETVQDTFQHLQEAVEAGEPPGIGVDHFDGLASEDVPVAADTGLLEIGEATEFNLSADERQIVMTDSDLTNPQAQQVAASGGFDGLDYSIVGDILLASDADGSVQTKDGALVVEAVRIHRVDVVDNGAVQSASVGNVPTLAASIAARSPAANAQFLTDSLRAAAAAYSGENTDMGNFDPSSFEDPSDALEAAADVIDDKDETIDDLEAQVEEHEQKANAFDQIAASAGLDPTDEDVSAQDVVDAHTEDLRREIADMEASLPKHDVDDVEARADELQGKTPDELQAIRGDRATEILRTDAEYDARNGAVPANSGTTEAAGGSGGGSTDEDADKLAENVMNGKDVIQARTADQSPAEYVEARYGVDPAEFDSEPELLQAISSEDGGDE